VGAVRTARATAAAVRRRSGGEPAAGQGPRAAGRGHGPVPVVRAELHGRPVAQTRGGVPERQRPGRQAQSVRRTQTAAAVLGRGQRLRLADVEKEGFCEFFF